MDVTAKKEQIRLVFSYARHNRKADLEGFLDANPDTFHIDDTDSHGNSLLCVACQNGHKTIAKVTLRRGSNINFQNKRGNTPLHFCYQYGFLPLAEYLQSKGADPELLNKRGLSCYEGLGVNWEGYGDGQSDDDIDMGTTTDTTTPAVSNGERDKYQDEQAAVPTTDQEPYDNEYSEGYGEGQQEGYYDENGNWIDYSGGYYDENGNWVDYSGGYYDEHGNWIEGYAENSEEKQTIESAFEAPSELEQVVEEVEEEEEEEEKAEPFLPKIASARNIEAEEGPPVSPIPSTPRAAAVLPDPPPELDKENEKVAQPIVTKRPPIRNLFDAVAADNVAGVKSLIAYGEKLHHDNIVLAMHWTVMRGCSGIATALRPLLNKADSGEGGSKAAASALREIGSNFSSTHKELLMLDACRSSDDRIVETLVHSVPDTTIDKGLVISAKRGDLEFIRMLMPHASPVGILKALVAAADGNHVEPMRALHANIQEYFAQNFNSKELLFEKHKDIPQSLHRALKDADEANLPDIASLLMSFTSSGDTSPPQKQRTKNGRGGPSALRILDVARSGNKIQVAAVAKDASQQNLVAALHTACLDGGAGPAGMILPHVNEVAKRQAFMAASAKGHDDVMKVLLPFLDTDSLARMFLAAGANGRIRTVELMINGGTGRITENERGRALLSAASSGHVAAVTAILAVVNDQRTRARALVSAAARGKVQVVHALMDHVTKEGLLDPSVIGPLHLPFLKDSTKDHSEIMDLLLRYACKKAGYTKVVYSPKQQSNHLVNSPNSGGHMSAANMLRRLADQQSSGGNESPLGSTKPKTFMAAPLLNVKLANTARNHSFLGGGSARVSFSSFGQKQNSGKQLMSSTARQARPSNTTARRVDPRDISSFSRTGPGWDGTAHHGHSRFRWRRGPLLGRGRFGSVHLAMNIENGELLAVKQVPIESQTDKRMLQREISLMRSMSVRSDHVVYCVATELFGDVFSIFMEYIPGGSIKTLIGEFGPLKEGVVQAYTKQMLSGLRILHDSGIAHRDIKADNLLLTDKGTLKLADFGSAKRISTATMHSTKAAQAIKGSPLWMAPEVIRQEIPVQDKDPEGNMRGWKRADVWSVGCTVIEMFTGKPPFDYFSNPTTAMFHIASCKEPPKFPTEMLADGVDFLNRCFAIKSDQRPSIVELSLHTYPVTDAANEDEYD
eukprot:Stramenopile-MAST_4_protein_2190